MCVHIFTPSIWELKVILGYTVGLRITWATFTKDKQKQCIWCRNTPGKSTVIPRLHHRGDSSEKHLSSTLEDQDVEWRIWMGRHHSDFWWDWKQQRARVLGWETCWWEKLTLGQTPQARPSADVPQEKRRKWGMKAANTFNSGKKQGTLTALASGLAICVLKGPHSHLPLIILTPNLAVKHTPIHFQINHPGLQSRQAVALLIYHLFLSLMAYHSFQRGSWPCPPPKAPSIIHVCVCEAARRHRKAHVLWAIMLAQFTIFWGKWKKCFSDLTCRNQSKQNRPQLCETIPQV